MTPSKLGIANKVLKDTGDSKKAIRITQELASDAILRRLAKSGMKLGRNNNG